jgi:hypothetical protein
VLRTETSAYHYKGKRRAQAGLIRRIKEINESEIAPVLWDHEHETWIEVRNGAATLYVAGEWHGPSSDKRGGASTESREVTADHGSWETTGLTRLIC